MWETVGGPPNTRFCSKPLRSLQLYSWKNVKGDLVDGMPACPRLVKSLVLLLIMQLVRCIASMRCKRIQIQQSHEWSEFSIYAFRFVIKNCCLLLRERSRCTSRKWSTSRCLPHLVFSDNTASKVSRCWHEEQDGGEQEESEKCLFPVTTCL